LYALTAIGCADPIWNGDPSKCEHIVEGACINGLTITEVEIAAQLARKQFGPLSFTGYLIEGVDEVTPDGVEGCVRVVGCDNNHTMHIQVKTLNQEWPCPLWILAHEFGHIALDDSNHHSWRWANWGEQIPVICPAD
jgi:hypothetical protein